MAWAVAALFAGPVLAIYILLVLLLLDESQPLTRYLLTVPVAYLIGSIPWGFLLTRITRGIDVREYGSGRIGMSNVMRTAGIKLALPVLLLDMTKGALAVFFARALSNHNPSVEAVAGLLALVGHNWPVFLMFRGGRGLATGAGAVGVLDPLALGLAIVSFIPVTLISRFLSLGSLTGVTVAVLVIVVKYILGNTPTPYLAFALVGGAIILWGHRDNIKRLLKGTERRIGQRAEQLTIAGRR